MIKWLIFKWLCFIILVSAACDLKDLLCSWTWFPESHVSPVLYWNALKNSGPFTTNSFKILKEPLFNCVTTDLNNHTQKGWLNAQFSSLSLQPCCITPFPEPSQLCQWTWISLCYLHKALYHSLLRAIRSSISGHGPHWATCTRPCSVFECWSHFSLGILDFLCLLQRGLHPLFSHFRVVFFFFSLSPETNCYLEIQVLNSETPSS